MVFAHRTDIFLKDDLLNGRGTDHFREPSQVGRAPIGPAHVPDIVSEQEGFETELGVFQIADGVFTRAGEVTNGFIFHLGTYTAVRSPSVPGEPVARRPDGRF